MLAYVTYRLRFHLQRYIAYFFIHTGIPGGCEVGLAPVPFVGTTPVINLTETVNLDFLETISVWEDESAAVLALGDVVTVTPTPPMVS